MTQKLLSASRVKALSRINRYNGWTSRPYSVLEHTVLGATAMLRMGKPQPLVRAFLLHDMHETEFGDEIRPVQRDYPNPALVRAKHEWDVRLFSECGLHKSLIGCTDVINMDNLMLSFELNHSTLVTRLTDRDFPEYDHRQKARIAGDINSGTYQGDDGIDQWWALWG